MRNKLVAFITVIGIVVFLWGMVNRLHSEEASTAKSPERPLVISDVEPLKKLQEPLVKFYHGKHVAALEKEGCVACHPQDEKSRFEFHYPKVRNVKNKRSLMNAYHSSCIGCHNERAQKKEKAGPIACGECHVPRDEGQWIKPVEFDYYLHYEHEKANEKKCELCHHIYDEAAKKLVYKKETESSCRDCHRQKDEEKRRSFRKVAHSDCINCHLQKAKEGKKAGPSACEKCHLELKEHTIKEMAEIPRPDRKQPKKVLIKTDGVTMKEVFFDHSNHEMNSRTCRTCHHETLNACKKCHTLKGSADGKGITLEEAYHKVSSSWSCNGCHKVQQAEQSCGGCHLLMERTSSMDKKACVVCHTGPIAERQCKSMLSAAETFMPDTIEQVIKISALEREYEASQFPHLKIVKKLTDISNKNKLSLCFHRNAATMCLGCHHYSSMEPKGKSPRCGSCHKEGFDLQDLSRPRLLAAYHLECLGCHEKMNLKQECADCHAEKPKNTAERKNMTTEQHQ
jgi:hypothetical protein